MSDLSIATDVLIAALVVGSLFGVAIKISMARKEKDRKILSKKKKRELEDGN